MYHPQKYSQNLGSFVTKAKELFKKHGNLLKWKSEPESILDLGIGDGRITNEVILHIIPKNVKEYVGLDISEIMLCSARNTIKHDIFKTFQFDAASKNPPEEMKNKFHHVFSNFCLHSMSDIRQAFLNIQYMLKPGGQLFFNTYEKPVTDEVYEKLDSGKWSRYNNRKAISPFYWCESPMKEYENLMKNIGFVDWHIYTEHFTPQLAEKALKDFLTAVNLRLPFVHEDDKEEYLREFLEECKKASMIRPIKDDQSNEEMFELHFDIITAVATKPK